MRLTTLGLSIAGHLALGFVLASLATHAPPPPAPSTTIELVDAAPPASPIVATAEASLAGGARTGTPRSAPRVAARSLVGPARTRIARSEVTLDDGDPRGDVRIETGGGDLGIDAGVVGDGEGRGHGGGIGAGHGRGIGLGDGARITSEAVALATPPAPIASKARVAKLVYPVREREVDDSELFVARVTIDDEGFVVGAKLVRGFGGPRDAQAADLIWKFRYAPALDDEGHPIRSTFEQRFLVGK